MSKFQTVVNVTASVAKTAAGVLVSTGSGSVVKSALMTTAPAKNKYVAAAHVVGAWAVGSLMAEKTVAHVNEQIDSAVESISSIEPAIAELKTRRSEKAIKKTETKKAKSDAKKTESKESGNGSSFFKKN